MARGQLWFKIKRLGHVAPILDAFLQGIGGLVDDFEEPTGVANLGDGLAGDVGDDDHGPQGFGKSVLNELDTGQGN